MPVNDTTSNRGYQKPNIANTLADDVGRLRSALDSIDTDMVGKASSTHTHGNITNAGAIGATANLPVITGTSGVLEAGSFGTTANTFCQGNDARLSDTRTPTDNTVSTAKLVNDAVTYAKIQNVSATDRLLGRSTAGAGDVEEITCTAAGRNLLDDADAAAQRTTLGLGTLATQSGTFSGTSSGTNTGDQTITLTGDVTGTGTGSFAATLANTTVTPGSYTYTGLTVDSKGRITAASNGTPVTSFSAGTTGLTPSTGTTGAITLAGTLAVANGGTGVTTSTGSGSNVLSTSPTLTTPLLGTPTSGTLTNCTGYTYANIASKPTTLSGYGITDALSNSASSTQSGYFGDVFLYDDTTPSHYLGITNSANLTAARTLSLNVNDANRTFSLSGDLTVSSAATISGTNTGDQTITLTGDITGTGTGSFTTAIASGVIVNADVNASAAIAGTKISPDFGSQNVVTTGNLQGASINGGPLAGMRNAIINGNFDIWQRGTSFTGNEYGADRWVNNRTGSTCTMSRQAFTLGQTDVPGEPTYFCRMAVTSVAGAGNFSRATQNIESSRTFAGQQVTISFWAKADAAKPISVELVQNFGTGGSPSTQVTTIGTTKTTLGTSWQKITVTAAVPSIGGKTLGSDGNDFLQLAIWLDAGSNFNSRTNSLGQQSGTFDIAQVQVEAGPVATPFERRPIGTELALCQRYFNRSTYLHTVNINDNIIFPSEMRASPSVAIAQGAGSTVTAATPTVGGFKPSASGLGDFTWTASAEL